MNIYCLRCWLFRHKAVVLSKPLLRYTDALGTDLLDLKMCQRCHAVFWEFLPL